MPRKGRGAAATTTGPTTATHETNGQAAASPVTDEQIAGQQQSNGAASKEIEDLSALRLQLAKETEARQAAERQVAAVEQRLSLLNQADSHILVAEQLARERHAVLVTATETLKAAKKDYDSAVIELRKRVGDRLEGRPSLFDVQEVASARGPVETKPVAATTTPTKKTPVVATPSPAAADHKPNPEARTDTVAPKRGRGRPPKATPTTEQPAATDAAPVTGAAVEVAKADGAVDDDKETGPIPAVPPVAAGWWMSASLGAVSVPGDKAGELMSLPPALVSALADGGVMNVSAAVEWMETGAPIKGVGPTGKTRLSEILKRWQATQGGDTQPGAKPTADAATAVNGSHRLCGGCQTRWPLPSTVTTCPKCNEQEMIFTVGFAGEPNADKDGDIVGGVDVIEFAVPSDGKDKGADDYKFAVLIATDAAGKCVAGYEVYYRGDVGDAVYPNVKHPRNDRKEALQHGLWLLRRAVLGFIPDGPTMKRWDEAAVAALGVEPKAAFSSAAV